MNPTVNVAFDIVATLIMTILLTISVSLMAQKKIQPLGGVVNLVCLLTVLVAVLSNCAPSKLSERPFSEILPEERCAALVDTLCDRVEACGYGAAAACFMDQAPACKGVTGITAIELDECRTDIRNMSCEGALPLSCQEIGEVGGGRRSDAETPGRKAPRETRWMPTTQSSASRTRPLE